MNNTINIVVEREPSGLGLSIAGGKESTPYKGDDEVCTHTFFHTLGSIGYIIPFYPNVQCFIWKSFRLFCQINTRQYSNFYCVRNRGIIVCNSTCQNCLYFKRM